MIVPARSSPCTAGSYLCSSPTPRRSRRGTRAGTGAPRCTPRRPGAPPGRSRTPGAPTPCPARTGSARGSTAAATGGSSAARAALWLSSVGGLRRRRLLAPGAPGGQYHRDEDRSSDRDGPELRGLVHRRPLGWTTGRRAMGKHRLSVRRCGLVCFLREEHQGFVEMCYACTYTNTTPDVRV